MSDGITEGDYTKFLKGAIGMTLSTAAMTFEKYVPIISVLSLLWQKFGPNTEEKKISIQDMVKRIIKEALAEAKEEEILAEINGLEQRYDMLRDILIVLGDKERDKPFVTTGLIEEMLYMAQSFGKFSLSLEIICKIDDKEDEDDEAKKLTDKKIKRCLKLSNLIIKLTVTRDLMLMKAMSALQQNNQTEVAEIVQKFISEDQIEAHELYHFVRDPINIRGSKKIFATFYSYKNGEMYSTLREYIFQTNQKLIKKDKLKDKTVICTKTLLGGICSEIENSSPEKWQQRHVTSMYIPSGVMVTINGLEDNLGPFYGPCILPNLPFASITALVKKSDHPDIDSTYMVIVCDKENFLPTARYMNFFQTGAQFSLKIEGNDWEKKIKSIIVPKGKIVKGYGHDSDGKDKVFGPYYGYIKVNKVEGEWKEMKIENFKAGYKRILLCSQNDLGGKCGSVLYKEALKNTWIELNKVGGIDFQNWSDDFYTNKVRSIEIPEGLSVRFWVQSFWDKKNLESNKHHKRDFEIGPYRGPTKKNIPDSEQWVGELWTYEKIFKVKFIDE